MQAAGGRARRGCRGEAQQRFGDGSGDTEPQQVKCGDTSFRALREEEMRGRRGIHFLPGGLARLCRLWSGSGGHAVALQDSLAATRHGRLPAEAPSWAPAPSIPAPPTPARQHAAPHTPGGPRRKDRELPGPGRCAESARPGDVIVCLRITGSCTHSIIHLSVHSFGAHRVQALLWLLPWVCIRHGVSGWQAVPMGVWHLVSGAQTLGQ